MNANSATTALVILTYIATSIFGSGAGNGLSSDTPKDTGKPGSTITTPADNGKGSSSGPSEHQVDPINRDAKVTQSANMRSGPSEAYNVLSTLKTGERIYVVGSKGKWYQVKSIDGRYGWIHTSLVRFIDANGGSSISNGDFEVVGYYIEDHANDKSSYNVVKANGSALTTIAPFSYAMDSAGNISGNHSDRAESLSEEKGLTNLALVHNIVNGNFSRSLITSFLNNKKARTNGVNNILKMVKAEGYHGVNIDFENVPPTDRKMLTQFLSELKAAFKPYDYKVTISVPAKTSDSPKSAWSGAFDYYEIGKIADQIMLMTYDEHVSGGAAGPVASYSWVENVIKYATTQIPKRKILLGIPGYGYDWNTQTHKAKAVTFQKALANAKKYGATPKFDEKSKSYTYTYTQSGVKRVVWFENADTLRHKLELVKDYGIGGIALWRLGQEDPAYWKIVKEELM